MMGYQIAKWKDYQARLDGKSKEFPWFKVHKKFLNSRGFFALADHVRWQWFGLLALADGDGMINMPDNDIAFNLRIDEFSCKPFIDNGLLLAQSEPSGHDSTRLDTTRGDSTRAETNGDDSLLREEKRREEKKREDSKPPLLRSRDSIDHIGTIIPEIPTQPAADLSDVALVMRILAATGDHPVEQWRPWWKDVLSKIQGFERESDLIEHLEYIEMCADPAQRKSKDLGEMKAPGKWLTLKCCQILDAYGQRLPSLPDGTARNGAAGRKVEGVA